MVYSPRRDGDIVIIDFDDILLSLKERRILYRGKRNSAVKFDKALIGTLLKYGLLVEHSAGTDKDGYPIHTGTYRLSDFGYRYKLWRARDKRNKYLTPVIVAMLTTIALHLLLWILLSIRGLLYTTFFWLPSY